jgi:hypothetical protein
MSMISTHRGEICGKPNRLSTHLWKHYLQDLLGADRIRSLKMLEQGALCQEMSVSGVCRFSRTSASL